MLEDLVNCKSRVEYLLKKEPKTRDCDKTLWLLYLLTFHDLASINHTSNPVKKLSDILLSKSTPTAESVRRIRQKFQESHLYIGTKRKQKLNESDNVRKWANGGETGI